MRRTLGLCGVLGVVCAAFFACDSGPSISDTQLGFTIVEGILQVQEDDPTTAAIVLSSTGGNCSTYQLGASVRNILLTDALVFVLQAGGTSSDGGYNPVTAGTYNVETGFVPDAGNIALVTEYETTAICQVTPTGANSGTITVQPYNPDAGGNSTVTYSIVFGYDRFNGAVPLSTCVIPASVKPPDAGTCFLPNGGGPT
jgi:hypothetical protein